MLYIKDRKLSPSVLVVNHAGFISIGPTQPSRGYNGDIRGYTTNNYQRYVLR